jgi:hypothetical protein
MNFDKIFKYHYSGYLEKNICINVLTFILIVLIILILYIVLIIFIYFNIYQIYMRLIHEL